VPIGNEFVPSKRFDRVGIELAYGRASGALMAGFLMEGVSLGVVETLGGGER